MASTFNPIRGAVVDFCQKGFGVASVCTHSQKIITGFIQGSTHCWVTGNFAIRFSGFPKSERGCSFIVERQRKFSISISMFWVLLRWRVRVSFSNTNCIVALCIHLCTDVCCEPGIHHYFTSEAKKAHNGHRYPTMQLNQTIFCLWWSGLNKTWDRRSRATSTQRAGLMGLGHSGVEKIGK